jgi:hypothetical protein
MPSSSKSTKGSLFREKSLEKLSSPEQIDKLMVVVTPKGWLALASLFALIIVGLIWSIVGTLPIEVRGKGIVLTPKGAFDISSPTSGTVTSFPVFPGEWITPQTAIATLSTGTIYSHAAGQIIETYYSDGDYVKEGDIVAWAKYPLEPGESHLMLSYFPIKQGEQVEPGMQVQIAPENVDVQMYGYLMGKVTDVSEFPLSNRSLLNHIRNQELVSFMKQGGTTVIKVTVEPLKDPNTPSGYRWTTPMGPPSFIEAGTICDVRIIVSHRKPISYLLPLLFKSETKLQGPNPDLFPAAEVGNKKP